MTSFLLDQDSWDLKLNGDGQIATCSSAYEIAQKVANSVRLFTNDAWFDPEKGIPHFDIELGIKPNIPLLRSRIHEAAMAVSGVAECDIEIYNITDRELTGNIKLTLKSGEKVDVTF